MGQDRGRHAIASCVSAFDVRKAQNEDFYNSAETNTTISCLHKHEMTHIKTFLN